MALTILSSLDNTKDPTHYNRSNFRKYYGLNQMLLITCPCVEVFIFFVRDVSVRKQCKCKKCNEMFLNERITSNAVYHFRVRIQPK